MTYGTCLTVLARAGAAVSILVVSLLSPPSVAQEDFYVNVWLRAELDNGRHVGDYANRLRFEADARADWDQHDSTKPMPPEPTRHFVLLSPEGIYHGTPIRQAVRSLPTDLDWVLTIPVAFQATGSGAFEIMLIPDGIPEGWGFQFRDLLTEEELDISTTETSTYAFTSSAVGEWEGRFEITIIPLSGSTNTAPEVSILTPEDGTAFIEDESVTFSATAEDAEEGGLSENLQWTSSLDGPVGTDATISTSALSVGTHTITAGALDSGGLSGLDTITVSIEGAVDTEGGPAAFRLTNATPNPAVASTSLTLRVSQAQHVTTRVYDALGRLMTTVHEGALPAGEDRRLTIDTSGLVAGIYVVHVEGETFAETRRISVVQ